MRDRSIRLTTTMGRPVDVVIMSAERDGVPFRWRSGAFDVDIGETDARRLLAFLTGHYGASHLVPPTAPPLTAPALVVRIAISGELGKGGRGIAEAIRLLGLALGRLSDGDLRGEIADAQGLRGVRWRSE